MYTAITTRREFFNALRQGAFAHGGYPHFFFGKGMSYSFQAVMENCREIGKQFRANSVDYVDCPIEGLAINWESVKLMCEVTGEHIEAAYSVEE